ncbi:MAG: ComEC/Rec2 family competence protein [Clostridia bacterium]|nr:ComEC/Rec2 family competence protein [Clostridia bacterium]
MNRTALICAALFVVASTLLCLLGVSSVLILGLILCLGFVISVIVSKRLNLKSKVSAVLLVGAAFCLYINVFNVLNVNRIEALDGKECIVICRAVEEPENYSSTVRVLVETNGQNGFDKGLFGKVRFYLFIPSEESAASVEEGDMLVASVGFSKIDKSYRNSNFANSVFIKAKYYESQIIGHSESLYTRCIDIRRWVRNCIYDYTDGDSAALLKGILLGGTADLSPKLYSAFKSCGVTHITAVSGMHISAFCMMLAYLLRYIMSRRLASFIAIFPLLLEVMLAGFTPSAVRSAIMCSILLLADCLIKRADALNSLGIAVASMLVFNPYYICNLGFQLSCAAAAGVILVSPYAVRLADRVVRFEIKYVTKTLKGIILTVLQTIGATLFTLPFQIIVFGFISTVFLPANVLICSPSVIAMALTVAGAVLHFLPFINVLAIIPFKLAEWMAQYMIAVVTLLADIPFSYIPFGSKFIVLWCIVSLCIIAVWVIFKRIGGIKLISLAVVGLLLVSLLSDYVFSRKLSTVTVINYENGFSTVVTYEKTCVIIGCGNGVNYDITDYMRENGIAKADMLLLLTGDRDCFSGYDFVKRNTEPEVTVIPENFGNSAVIFGESIVVGDGEIVSTKDKKIGVKVHIFDGGCAYEINLSGRKVLIGCGEYTAEDVGLSKVNILVGNNELPLNIQSDYVLYSGKDENSEDSNLYKRVFYAEGTISARFKKGKGMRLNAG